MDVKRAGEETAAADAGAGEEAAAADAGVGEETAAADAGRPGGTAAEGAEVQPAEDPRPRTKAAQRDASTKALIAAARELFAERGYAGVGTEEIVQRAGLTRGALYHHFKRGKEELFQAVLVQVSAETTNRVMAAAAKAEDPWEELVIGVNAFLDACVNPEVQRIVLIDGPAVLGWDVWRAADADQTLGLLEAVLQQAIDAGRMAPQPPRALAHVLLGAIDEAAMVVARADDPREARQEMGRTIHRLLEGLRGPTL